MAQLNRVVSLGAGEVSVKDSDGNALLAALLMELSVDRSWTTKELESGDGLEPEDVAQTGRKTTIKSKCNAIYAAFLGSLVGGTVATGGDDYDTEPVTLTTDVHLLVSSHAAATPVNRGVILASGAMGKLVVAPATPAVGEYTFDPATGTWTFNAAERGAVLCKVSYTNPDLISVSEGDGTVGEPTYLELLQFVSYKGQKLTRKFFRVVVTKVSESSKSRDHNVYDVDFTAYKDPTTGLTCVTTLSK